MNVNEDFFRRFSAENKLKMAQSLTDSDINRMTYETLSRIIKEACNDKNYRTVRFVREKRVSNDWNSDLESVCCLKRREPCVCFTVFYSNTDGTAGVPLKELFRKGDLRFSYEYTDRYDDKQTAHYSYSEEKVIEIKRNIVISCIESKYADKLKKAVA